MDEDNAVLLRLKRLSNLLDRFMAEVKSDIERQTSDVKHVSIIQGRIIHYLYSLYSAGNRAVFQKDIEAYFDIRSSTAAIVLRRMENNGLVTRETSADDVRKKTVHLTQKALRMHKKAHRELQRAEARAVKGLTEEELAVFQRVLDKITDNVS